MSGARRQDHPGAQDDATPATGHDARSWAPGRTSPLGSFGPLAVIAVSLLAVLGSVAVRDWRVGALTLGVQALLLPLVAVRRSGTLRRLVPGMVAAASIGFSSWMLGDHEIATGVSAALRILTFVVPAAVLTAHVDPSAFGDALAQRLHAPARPVVAAVAALQRLESLGDDWRTIERARRTRGLGPGWSPPARARAVTAVTFALLVSSLRRSGRMAVAMDARGFAGATRRTWAEPAPWHRRDTALVAVGVAVALLPAALSRVL